jgi:hypothetical protein
MQGKAYMSFGNFDALFDNCLNILKGRIKVISKIKSLIYNLM